MLLQQCRCKKLECFLLFLYHQYKYDKLTGIIMARHTGSRLAKGHDPFGHSDMTVTGWLKETFLTKRSGIDESLQHYLSHIKCHIFISEKNEPIPLQEFIKSAAMFLESRRGLIIHYSPAAPPVWKNVIKSISLNVLPLLHLQCKVGTSRPHPVFLHTFFFIFVIPWKAPSDP